MAEVTVSVSGVVFTTVGTVGRTTVRILEAIVVFLVSGTVSSVVGITDRIMGRVRKAASAKDAPKSALAIRVSAKETRVKVFENSGLIAVALDYAWIIYDSSPKVNPPEFSCV